MHVWYLIPALFIQYVGNGLKRGHPVRNIWVYFQEYIAVFCWKQTQGNANGYNYSGMIIQFAMMLQLKVSGSKCDFFQNYAALLDRIMLLEYTSTDFMTLDSSNYLTGNANNAQMHQRNRWLPPICQHCMWLSCHQGRTCILSSHINNIMGYTHDCFYMGLIADQYKQMMDSDVSTNI